MTNAKTTTKEGKTMKTTKRIETLKQNNERRKEESRKKLLEAVANSENPVNKKSLECVSILKTTKDRDNKQFTDNLYQLACIITQSKLKNIQRDDAKYRKETAQIKSDLGQLFYHGKGENDNTAQRAIYLQQLGDLYVTEYNSNGDTIVKCTDKQREKKIIKELENLTRLESAEDLLQDITLKLWYYIEKALQAVSLDYDKLPVDCLLTEFETLKLHTTTYKNGHKKPVELWETTYTNAVKESAKEVSRFIDKRKAIKENNIAYEELETTIINPVDGEEQTVIRYRKAPKIAIVDTMDGNGKPLTQTADNSIVELIEKILDTANFSHNQSFIFKKYFCEYWTITELSDKMKVRKSYIEKELAVVKQKAVETGLFENIGYTEENINNKASKAQKIACYAITDEQTKTFVCCFESLGKASKALNIDKGHISANIKGKRKTVGGFCFEYVKE